VLTQCCGEGWEEAMRGCFGGVYATAPRELHLPQGYHRGFAHAGPRMRLQLWPHTPTHVHLWPQPVICEPLDTTSGLWVCTRGCVPSVDALGRFLRMAEAVGSVPCHIERC
jgi:hypothetical protein